MHNGLLTWGYDTGIVHDDINFPLYLYNVLKHTLDALVVIHIQRDFLDVGALEIRDCLDPARRGVHLASLISKLLAPVELV